MEPESVQCAIKTEFKVFLQLERVSIQVFRQGNWDKWPYGCLDI